jgi:hypothetical protein
LVPAEIIRRVDSSRKAQEELRRERKKAKNCKYNAKRRPIESRGSQRELESNVPLPLASGGIDSQGDSIMVESEDIVNGSPHVETLAEYAPTDNGGGIPDSANRLDGDEHLLKGDSIMAESKDVVNGSCHTDILVEDVLSDDDKDDILESAHRPDDDGDVPQIFLGFDDDKDLPELVPRFEEEDDENDGEDRANEYGAVDMEVDDQAINDFSGEGYSEDDEMDDVEEDEEQEVGRSVGLSRQNVDEFTDIIFCDLLHCRLPQLLCNVKPCVKEAICRSKLCMNRSRVGDSMNMTRAQVADVLSVID